MPPESTLRAKLILRKQQRDQTNKATRLVETPQNKLYLCDPIPTHPTNRTNDAELTQFNESHSIKIAKHHAVLESMAIEHAYPIVPFAAVGAEECYDIIFDGNDVLSVPIIGDIIKRIVIHKKRDKNNKFI